MAKEEFKNEEEFCGGECWKCGEYEKERPKEGEQGEQLHKLLRELKEKNEKVKNEYKRKKPRK